MLNVAPITLKTARRRILHLERGTAPTQRLDELAREEPLEIQIDTRPVSVTMRTPGHDQELAAGFLLTEGLVERSRDIASIKVYPRNKSGNVLNIFLAPHVTVDFSRLTRHLFASSSCGLCGKATIAAVHQHFKPIRSGLTVKIEKLHSLQAQMRGAQEAFERTGGIHAAALFDKHGRLIVLREDIGRHNAVDKVLGYGLLRELLPFDRHILLVSGRASFEIMQKALAARVPVVCAVSAPSSLAVEFALASRQTLIGFLRSETMNIYTCASRVVRRRPGSRK